MAWGRAPPVLLSAHPSGGGRWSKVRAFHTHTKKMERKLATRTRTRGGTTTKTALPGTPARPSAIGATSLWLGVGTRQTLRACWRAPLAMRRGSLASRSRRSSTGSASGAKLHSARPCGRRRDRGSEGVVCARCELQQPRYTPRCRQRCEGGSFGRYYFHYWTGGHCICTWTQVLAPTHHLNYCSLCNIHVLRLLSLCNTTVFVSKAARRTIARKQNSPE